MASQCMGECSTNWTTPAWSSFLVIFVEETFKIFQRPSFSFQNSFSFFFFCPSKNYLGSWRKRCRISTSCKARERMLAPPRKTFVPYVFTMSASLLRWVEEIRDWWKGVVGFELLLELHFCSWKGQVYEANTVVFKPRRIGLQPEWHQEATSPIQLHYLPFLIFFFISGRRSSTEMEIKRFLRSRFKAVCLRNVVVNPSTKASECVSFPLGK